MFMPITKNIFSSKINFLYFDKSTFKPIPNNFFINGLKVLLDLGTYDYTLLKNIQKNSITFNDFLYKKDLLMGAGFISRGTDKNFFDSKYENYKYISLTKKKDRDNFKEFCISDSLNKLSEFKMGPYHRVGIKKLYEGSRLLVRARLDGLMITSVVDYPCVFSNSVYGIKCKKGGEDFLYFLGGLISSKLFSWMIFILGSKIGIERNNLVQKDFENIPLPKNLNLKSKTCKNIIKSYKEMINLKKPSKPMLDTLNKEIYQLYEMNEFDRYFIDYCCDLVISSWDNYKKEKIGPCLFIKNPYLSLECQDQGRH